MPGAFASTLSCSCDQASAVYSSVSPALVLSKRVRGVSRLHAGFGGGELSRVFAWCSAAAGNAPELHDIGLCELLGILCCLPGEFRQDCRRPEGPVVYLRRQLPHTRPAAALVPVVRRLRVILFVAITAHFLGGKTRRRDPMCDPVYKIEIGNNHERQVQYIAYRTGRPHASSPRSLSVIASGADVSFLCMAYDIAQPRFECFQPVRSWSASQAFPRPLHNDAVLRHDG